MIFKGRRECSDEVIFIPLNEDLDKVKSISDKKGNVYPAQKKGNGLIAVVNSSREDEEYQTSEVFSGEGVEIKKNGKALDVYIRGELFTSYNFDEKYPKPFLGPVYTSQSTSFTRPDFNAEEHPHQRSVFVGVGDVNGIDFWNENPNSLGYVRHKGFCKAEGGSAYGVIEAENTWCDMKENPVLDEKRTFTFYNQSKKCRYIDVKITFTAAYKDIKFGPTKEAGPLGVRVNEEMRADRTGEFYNSYGGKNEEECWGRAASWCDYKGFVDGKKYGIAVFDNEDNERYPTTWHIRNYGLFAANNLYFKGGIDIPWHYSLTYKYRICFYEGEENIKDRFLNYAK